MFNLLNEGEAMLGVRLDDDLEQRLTSVARSQGRSKSDIAREAVRRYVELHDASLREEARRQSLRADAGEGDDEPVFWEAIEAQDARWS